MKRRESRSTSNHPSRRRISVPFWPLFIGIRWATLAYVAVALSAPGTSRASNAKQPTSCQLKEYLSLGLGFLKDGTPVVPVTINGHSARMFLEVDAPFTTFFDYGVPLLGLKTQKVPYSDRSVSFGGKRVDQYASAASFRLGSLGIQMLRGVVEPNVVINPTSLSLAELVYDNDVVGTFAPLGLRGVDVELDLGHGKLNLFQASTCEETYWSSQFAVAPMHQGGLGDWYYDMVLDGKKLQTKLLTSSPDAYIYSTVTKDLYGWDDSSPEVKQMRDSSGRVVHRYRAMSLTMPGLSVMNAQIDLRAAIPCGIEHQLYRDINGAEGFVGCEGTAPLEIGTSVLKQLRIYIAVNQKKLYFTAADAH